MDHPEYLVLVLIAVACAAALVVLAFLSMPKAEFTFKTTPERYPLSPSPRQAIERPKADVDLSALEKVIVSAKSETVDFAALEEAIVSETSKSGAVDLSALERAIVSKPSKSEIPVPQADPEIAPIPTQPPKPGLQGMHGSKADVASLSQATTAVTVYEEKPPSAKSEIPVPTIPASRPPQGMQLKLRRSQRTSMTGKVLFVLDARMAITADEAQLVAKYRLGDNVIYESSSRQQHRDATLAHLEMTRGGPRFSDSAGSQLLGAGKTLYRLARAGASATAAALSLRITVHGLIAGVHVECKSMGELLGAESAIVEAAQSLRTYLETAATFDGREEIIEF